MSAANAREAAEKWVLDHAISEDLRGRTVYLVTFHDEEACRFYYPRRALKFHQQITSAISRICRARRAKIQRVYLTVADWHLHAELASVADTPDERRKFADMHQRLA